MLARAPSGDSGFSRFLGLLIALTVLGILQPGLAAASSITATASGASKPVTKTYPDTVVSGDFTYTGNGKADATKVGDGVDETVTWSFNFTKDPAWASFPKTGSLSTALLTMNLTPRSSLITTDAVRIVGLKWIGNPDIFSKFSATVVGQEQTVSFDLLKDYTSSQILKSLADHAGSIPMEYQDDANIRVATLELTAVPEPSAVMLLASGGVGLSVLVRRWRRARS